MTEIVSTDDTLGGAPRIDGRRIGVHHVVKRVLEDGTDPAQVAADYDLDLADIHRALTYYYDHPDEIRDVRERLTTPPDDQQVFRSPEEFKQAQRKT